MSSPGFYTRTVSRGYGANWSSYPSSAQRHKLRRIFRKIADLPRVDIASTPPFTRAKYLRMARNG